MTTASRIIAAAPSSSADQLECRGTQLDVNRTRRKALPNDNALNVLLIENDAEDVLLIREALDRESGTCRLALQRADSLQSGLACLAEGGIDVVLLDLTLP